MTSYAVEPAAVRQASRPIDDAGGVGARRVSLARLAIGVLVVLALAAGLLLRLWVLGRQPVGSDEAVVGLMAHEILRGHLFAFYWGQRYGGGEPYVVAAVFALFGQSTFTLGLAPVLLDGLAAVLVWRIGRRLFSRSVGVAAALLFWVWPEVYAWQSTIEYGFRLLALDCGLSLMLVALRLAEPGGESSRGRLALWAALGASVGVGWWCTPEIAYYALPSGVLLAWRLARRRVDMSASDAAVALAAATVGALPWLWDNVTSGFPSVGARTGPDTSFVLHLRVLVHYVLPIVLGLRLRVSGRWLLQSGSSSRLLGDLSEALYVLALVVAATWLVRLVMGRRALVLVGFLVFFPLYYAYLPDTWFWQDGRYAIYLAPVAALVAMSAADGGARWIGARWFGARAEVRGARGSVSASRLLPLAAVVVAGLALTVGATTHLAPYRPEVSPGRTTWLSWRANPDGAVATTVHALVAAGVHDVYAGYWLAYVVDFEGRGQVVASEDVPVYVRYAPFLREIERAARPGWLFENPALRGQAAAALGTTVLDPGCAAKFQTCLLPSELESWLTSHEIGYRIVAAGDFLAVVPARRIDPTRILDAYGIAG